MSTETYTVVACLHTGEPVAVLEYCETRKLELISNGIDSFDLEIGLDQPGSSRVIPWNRVKIYQHSDGDTQLIFYGICIPELLEDDFSEGVRKATYLNPMYILTRIFNWGTELYTTLDAAQLVNALLYGRCIGATPAVHTYIDNGVAEFVVATHTGSPVDVPRDYTGVVKPLYDVIQELLGLYGSSYEYEFTYVDGWADGETDTMGYIRMAGPHLGVSRPNAVLMYGNQLASNVSNVRRTWAKQVNYETVLGQTAVGGKISGVYGVGGDSNPTPTLEDIVGESSLTTQARVENIAESDVREQRGSVKVWRIEEILDAGPTPLVDFGLGDEMPLYVKHRGTNVETTVHVCSILIDISDTNQVTRTLVTCEEDDS